MRPTFDSSERWDNETVQQPIKLKDLGLNFRPKTPLPPAHSTGFSEADIDEAKTVEWRRPRPAADPLGKTRSNPAIPVASSMSTPAYAYEPRMDLPTPVDIGSSVRIRPIWVVTVICLVIGVVKGVPYALDRVDVVNGKLITTAPASSK